MENDYMYHVQYKNATYKKDAIKQSEMECPSCGSGDNSQFRSENRGYGRFQNHYVCKKCGSEWYGNTYTAGGDIIHPENSPTAGSNKDILMILFFWGFASILLMPGLSTVMLVICGLMIAFGGLKWYRSDMYHAPVEGSRFITKIGLAGLIIIPLLKVIGLGLQFSM